MGLCDWQNYVIGDPMRDVAYAISALLEVEDRKAWDADLLKIYAAEMSKLTGRQFAYDDIYRKYRQWLLAALLMWTPTLVPAENFPAMQPREMSMKMIKRITAAIEDADSLNAF